MAEKIVEAVAYMTGRRSKNRELSQRIDAAVSKAIADAIAGGMDPNSPDMHGVILKAREKARADYSAEMVARE